MKMTLNQSALAARFRRPASAIRAQGEIVRGRAPVEHEVWRRLNYANGRLAGYERIATGNLTARKPARHRS